MNTEPARVMISYARDNDLDAAVDLFMGYLEFYGRHHDRRDMATFLVHRRERSESLLLLAWVDVDGEPTLAGMAHVYPTFSTLSLAPTWTLNDLFVVPEMRGSGVGRSLLQTVVERAHQAGVGEIALETAGDNAPARRLYESEGFETDRDFLHYTLSLSR